MEETLTVIIRAAKDGLLRVLLLSLVLVFHPQRDAELLTQAVVQSGLWDDDGSGGSIELIYLVALTPLIRPQFPGPLAPDSRRGQEVHALRTRPCHVSTFGNKHKVSNREDNSSNSA